MVYELVYELTLGQHIALTIRECDKYKYSKKQYVWSHGGGLNKRASPKQNEKIWLYRYTFNGKRTMVTLGNYKVLGLKEARKERDKLKALLSVGKDPKVVKATKFNTTVKEQIYTLEILYELATQERITAPTRPWSDSHTKRTKITWKHLKSLYKTPITDITKPMLRQLLVKVNLKTPATAQQCKNLLSVIYTYAEVNDIVPKNLIPMFANDPILKKRALSDIEQHPPIPLKELGGTYAAIKNYAGAESRAFLFCSGYTALRVKSLLLSQWSDYDEAEGILNIKKHLVKNRKAIRCPVVKQMAQLFQELKDNQTKLNRKWNKKCFIFSTDGEFTGDGEVEGYDENGNFYELEVD